MSSPRPSVSQSSVFRPSVLIGAALAAAAVVAVPAPADAQVAAKVESQTRPNFGVLLDPPTRSRARPPVRRWSYGDHRRGWRPDHGAVPGADWGRPGHPGRQEEIVLVDCGGNPGTGAVEDAVRRVRPGGTLVIRARGGACVGWLNVDKPLTIIGEGGLDPRDWNANSPATLQAPDGLPCLTVAQGVRVEVRDVVFASPRAGDAACVVGYGAEIVMNRVGFRHAGDEAAIYADGGLLDLRNAIVDARTIAPAIVADGAAFSAYEVVVSGAQSGLELIPGAATPATLSAVTLNGPETPNNFGPRAIGVMVRSGRDYGRVDISNAKICGYVEGVAVEGASVTVTNSRICRADKGAVLYNGELTLTNSRVRADEIGVAAASGRVVARDNSFAGVREVFYDERRASLEASGNRVWSPSLCQPRFEPRYRSRYAPVWDSRSGYGWTCQSTPYPRDWWTVDDGSYGLVYDAYLHALDGYNRYLQGYGWYDNGGRYVDDSRYFGEDRWRRGR